MSITSDILRGHTDAIILSHLLEKDSYGYQINKDIMKKTGSRYELKEATLYSAFRRLEQAGYIRPYWGDESGTICAERIRNCSLATRTETGKATGQKGKKIMTEKIRNYINELFMDAPKTRKAFDLKEEVTLNTIEKYQDLVSEGYREEDAYQNVISSIGDVTELFADLEDPVLYVFLLGMTLSDALSASWKVDFGMLGMVLTIIICIPPTCLLVYVGKMYPDPHNNKHSAMDLCLEKAPSDNHRKVVNASISTIIWTMTLALYFLISFSTHHWEVTWVIFLIGSCAQAILTLWNSLHKK